MPALLAAMTIVWLRAATSHMWKAVNVPPASSVVHVAPLSVVRSNPIGDPPTRFRLLKRPLPATSVRCVLSVGSISRAPTDSDCWASVSCFQVGVAFCAFLVRQTPH
jgi:hypothetical protein